MLFLVLFVGNAGKAEVGGPRDGRADRGNDVAIVLVYVVIMKPCSKLCAPLSWRLFHANVASRREMFVLLSMQCAAQRLWSSNEWLGCKVRRCNANLLLAHVVYCRAAMKLQDSQYKFLRARGIRNAALISISSFRAAPRAETRRDSGFNPLSAGCRVDEGQAHLLYF